MEKNSTSKLQYDTPANDWDYALPIGNGRLGAMVYGRTGTELLQLNENSVWYGGPQNRTPPDALKHLALLRQLIRRQDHLRAEKLMRRAFFASPHSQRHYEPLGTLTLEFDHAEEGVENYQRELDLDTAITSVQYKYGGIEFTRSVFTSYPDNVLVIELKSSKKSEVVIRLTRVSEREYETNEFVDSIEASNGTIVMHATPGGRGSNRLCCIVKVKCADDGKVETIGNSLVVNSSMATIVVSAQTTFRFPDPEATASDDVRKALFVADMKQRHIEDYISLYGCMKLQLRHEGTFQNTDQRLQGQPDPALVTLYHNYGRYLLISCSRPGHKTLPATLQGLWNPSFQPAWGSKYTININLQMNYWGANICNLEECEDPLFELLERLAESGKQTAKVMYGCRGWAAHHNTDIWADSDPQDQWMPATGEPFYRVISLFCQKSLTLTVWPLGGAWLCYHIWERYNFNGSIAFLERFFPVLKGCVQFCLDFLIEDSAGKYLVTNPSLSPENTFLNNNNEKGVLCEGSSIDIQIIDAIFEAFIGSVSELGIPDNLLEDVKAKRNRLPPMQIGYFGQLQEWQHDHTEFEPGKFVS